MRIAKELGKSLAEVMQFSVHEIQLWTAWFRMESEAMKGGENKHRNPRRR